MKLKMQSFDFEECTLTFRVPKEIMHSRSFGNVPGGVEVDIGAITGDAALILNLQRGIMKYDHLVVVFAHFVYYLPINAMDKIDALLEKYASDFNINYEKSEFEKCNYNECKKLISLTLIDQESTLLITNIDNLLEICNIIGVNEHFKNPYIKDNQLIIFEIVND